MQLHRFANAFNRTERHTLEGKPRSSWELGMGGKKDKRRKGVFHQHKISQALKSFPASERSDGKRCEYDSWTEIMFYFPAINISITKQSYKAGKWRLK